MILMKRGFNSGFNMSSIARWDPKNDGQYLQKFELDDEGYNVIVQIFGCGRLWKKSQGPTELQISPAP